MSYRKGNYTAFYVKEVPTVHVPMRKAALAEALSSSSYMVQTKARPGSYRL